VEKGATVPNTVMRSFFIVVVGGLLTLGACTTSDSAADKAFNDDMAACERQQTTDQRQMCFGAAMQKYQAAKAKANSSTCPRASC
jgi:hypothetical protein